MKTVEVEKCMVPHCQRGEAIRGLCNTHHVAASRMVRKQKTTWEKLEKEGKIKPCKKKYTTSNQSYFLGDK